MKPIYRNKDKGNCFVRFGKSLRNASRGFWYTLKHEQNMLIILLASFVVLYAGIRFEITEAEWLFCIAIIVFVMAAELINTAIEAMVDLQTTEFHPLAKIAKDCGSAATFVLSIIGLIVCLSIFIPYFVDLIK